MAVQRGSDASAVLQAAWKPGFAGIVPFRGDRTLRDAPSGFADVAVLFLHHPPIGRQRLAGGGRWAGEYRVTA